MDKLEREIAAAIETRGYIISTLQQSERENQRQSVSPPTTTRFFVCIANLFAEPAPNGSQVPPLQLGAEAKHSQRRAHAAARFADGAALQKEVLPHQVRLQNLSSHAAPRK